MPLLLPRVRSLTVALILALTSSAAVAQAPDDSVAHASLFHYVSLHPKVAASAGILAGGATISLFDQRIQHEVREFRDWSGPGTQHVSKMTSSIGGYLPIVVGGTLAVGGWAFHNDFVKHVGMDVSVALLASGLVTTAIKGVVGRARPRTFPDDPDMYYPGRGFTNNARASFPSGHTSAAFASAAVLATELSHAHPRHSRWIKFGMYSAATAVGFSRMYQDAHWASDVFVGAAIGVWSGWSVVHRRESTK